MEDDGLAQEARILASRAGAHDLDAIARFAAELVAWLSVLQLLHRVARRLCALVSCPDAGHDDSLGRALG